MISGKIIQERQKNEKKILEAILLLRENFSAPDIVEASGVTKLFVYRTVAAMHKKRHLRITREMRVGTNGSPRLFSVSDEDGLRESLSLSYDYVSSESVRLENRQRIVDWAKTKKEMFSAMDASLELGITSVFISAFLRVQSAVGDFIVCGKRGTTGSNTEFLYAYAAHDKPTNNNIFRELIQKGHDEDFVHREPAESTHYPPGSPQKVEVMAARVGRGESPYHPNDVKVGASGHESDGGCEGLPAIRWVDTAATGRVLRKAIS